MLMLARCEPMTMRRSAEKQRMDPSNLTNLIARMEARGLVLRRPTPEDRRAKAVEVTPAGAEVAERILGGLVEGNPAAEGLEDEELRALRATLRRLVAEPVEVVHRQAGRAGGAGAGAPEALAQTTSRGTATRSVTAARTATYAARTASAASGASGPSWVSDVTSP